MFGTKLQPQLQPGPERDTCRRNKALLTLRLGLTCYKDFLGTNWSQEAGELRRRGETEFGDPLALLAQPLGVGGVLRTRDGQVVLIRRSQRVAEAGGLLDIPGGHPEPKVREREVDKERARAGGRRNKAASVRFKIMADKTWPQFLTRCCVSFIH